MEPEFDNLVAERNRGRILSGVILIIVGVAFFARQMGMGLPEWMFNWPMFLIVLGFYVGAKHSFRRSGWLVLVAVGTVFMLEHIYPEMNLGDYFWPLLLILAGVFMVLKPNRDRKVWDKYCGNRYNKYPQTETDENRLEIVAVMGGVKKNVVSKSFTGGNIDCVMGGAEINLSMADMESTAVLEINNILGGTKLIVPASWDVVSEVMVVLGGVEDKRTMHTDNTHKSGKTLVIKGSCIFGGVDIRSY